MSRAKNTYNKFNYLLIEMSTTDAEKVLDLKDGDSLEKAYKKAAMKHHPDRGGSEEMMKKVNQAYELLKGSGNRNATGQYKSRDQFNRDYEKQRQEYEKRQKEKAARQNLILDDIYKKVQSTLDDYTAHFKEYFPLDKKPELKKVEAKGDLYNNGSIQLKWGTEDGKTDIRLHIYLRSTQGKGLSYDADEPEYEVDYATEIYHNRKIHKIGTGRYQYNKLTSDVLDPTKIFTKPKLKRIISKPKTVKMRKGEFQKALTSEMNKLGGRWFNDNYIFDLGRADDVILTMFRMTGFRRNDPANWSLVYRKAERNKKNGDIWRIGAGYARSNKPDGVVDLPIGFPETSTALDMLAKLVKKIKKNKKVSKEYFKPAWDEIEGK